jgi:hypothetical protein
MGFVFVLLCRCQGAMNMMWEPSIQRDALFGLWTGLHVHLTWVLYSCCPATTYLTMLIRKAIK